MLAILGRLGAAFLLVGGAAAALAAAPAPGCFEVVREGELPASLEWARDVRWAKADSVYLALMQQGIFEWAIGPGDANSPDAKQWAARGYGRSDIMMPRSLATTDRQVVVGSVAYAFGYGSRNGSGLQTVFPFEEIFDLDAQGETIAVYGSQRDEKGNYAPEGALAWLGKLGQDPALWKPLHISESGPEIPSFQRCGWMSIGAVRFLSEGSILVVPGVEGGAFLYDREGRLLRTFSAEALGFDSGCPLDPRQAKRYAMDERGRWDWVNGRRVVDEILPLPDGKAGLIVREMRNGIPLFELVVVSRDGLVRRCPLAIENAPKWSRIQGDVRGEEVFLLLAQEGFQPKEMTRTDLETGSETTLPAVLHPEKKTRFLIGRYRQ